MDALVSAALERRGGRRWAVAVAALTVAVASLVTVSSLWWRSRGRLLMWDAAAVVAVGIAAAGHVALAIAALAARRRWPLRQRTLGDILLFVGWLSVLTGVAGAIGVTDAAPNPRVVRGVPVNGVLEFFLTGFLYSLPGLMLLGLRFVAFARSAPRSGRAVRTSTEQAPFFVEATERLEPAQLSQSWTEEPRPTTPALDEQIEGTWQEASRAAEAKGRRLYNGELIRASAVSGSADGLHLRLGKTCFRDFVGTNIRAALEGAAIDPAHLADPLGVSALVVTRDGYLGLGRRRSELAMHGGFLHTFGGLVEGMDRRSDGKVDIVGAVLRELFEEVRVERDEIGEVWITGVVRDRSLRQPELLFDVSLTVTRHELLRRFDPADPDQEHTALEFVHDEPESILPFLQRSAPVAPVAAAALLLHGRHAWGTEWYDQTCLVLFGALPGGVGDATASH